MSVIVCPKCRRQYQVQGNPTGQTVKCTNCQTVFTAGQSGVPAAAVAAAPATSQSKLFPDPSSVLAGPDPLSNHVVQDPGFVDVDLDEVRRQREAKERKKSRYDADDPLAKFKREQQEKAAEEAEQKKKSRLGIKIGFIGAFIYILLLVVGAILANNFEWGFWVIFGLAIFAAVLGFLVDMTLVQYVKENDPEQYLFYAFLPPYRIYYWIVNWKFLMMYVVIEMIIAIPMIVNFWLLYYFDQKWAMGWFEF